MIFKNHAEVFKTKEQWKRYYNDKGFFVVWSVKIKTVFKMFRIWMCYSSVPSVLLPGHLLNKTEGFVNMADVSDSSYMWLFGR